MQNSESVEDRAKAWLEANTPLRWSTEPDPACPDEPFEVINRRPQLWANRLASFAQVEIDRFIAEVEKEMQGSPYWAIERDRERLRHCVQTVKERRVK